MTASVDRSSRRGIFVLILALVLLLASRERPWADAQVTWDTAGSILERGSLAVTTPLEERFFATHDGAKYGVFPLGNVVAMLPGRALHAVLSERVALDDDAVTAFACHLMPALLMAATAVVFHRLARRFGATTRVATMLTLMLGLSTICFVYARSSYSEAVQTFALTWAFERAVAARDDPTAANFTWLGVAAGVVLNTKLLYAIALPPLALLALLRVERRQVILFGVLGFAPLAVAALAHNALKTGSIVDSGYREVEGLFSGDLLPGLYGLTLSTGKSLFLYSPPLVLAVLGVRASLRRHRSETIALLSIVIALLVANAKFRHWHADYCWGPRHTASLTPLLLLLAVPIVARRRRVLIGSLAGSGVAVQLLGAAFYWDHFIRIMIAVKDRTGAHGWFREQLSHAHYIPQFSPIRGHIWLLDHFVRRDADLGADAPWRLHVPRSGELDFAWERLRLDWWALDWGNERSLAVAWALTWTLALLWSIVTLRRASRRGP